MLYQFI